MSADLPLKARRLPKRSIIAAAVLVALTNPKIEPLMGLIPGIKAFVAAVVGGIGNLRLLQCRPEEIAADGKFALQAHDPALLVSEDGGDSWRLALTADFVGR